MCNLLYCGSSLIVFFTTHILEMILRSYYHLPCPALVTTIHSSSSSISLTFIFNVTITMIG